ncbi:MAG: hypothetical protein PHQ47_03575 [Candidatus Portnoybacteria bacterium]|nr:hypothetical protein [Candidatus Portnoybacteria bacterium]
MDEQKNCPCGTPLNAETACSCDPGACIHCCKCPADCQCGCQQKAQKEA